jgi:putative ABC transport system permease protein
MHVSNLKTAARRLFRQKRFSLINILGLSIGLAACLLLFLYVQYELSYDAYNHKASRIVRITSSLHTPESDLAIAMAPAALAPVLLRECPELAATVRIEPGDFNVRDKREVVAAKDFYFSEPAIFSVFSFSFLEGSAVGALRDPHSIVLTQSAAKNYFGSAAALGKTLLINGAYYHVTAVIRDLPANSDLPINALLSKQYPPNPSWTDFDVDAYTFLLFRNDPDLRRFNSRLSGLTNKYTQPELDRQGVKEYHINFEAERLTDVHFSKDKLADTVKGNREFLTIFGILAIFILLIALLNYINLSTATATQRAKEVGVRKAIGARPRRLIRQFLLESAFLVSIAWIFATLLVLIAIPFFDRLLSVRLYIEGWRTILFPAILFPLTVLSAGGYPAFILSGFSPINALRGHSWGHSGKDAGAVGLRRLLTALQFVIALVMLTGTIAIYRQMRYIEQKDLGADRAGVLCVNIPADSVARSGAPAFIQALRHESNIRDLSVGSGIPSEGLQLASTTTYAAGKQRMLMCNYLYADPRLLPMLKIRLAAGRNFSDSLSTDKQEAFLVNEAFVRKIGWRNALGQTLEGNGNKGKVIGVVKDFFYKSLHNTIEPAIMIYRTDPPLAVLLKTPPNQLPRVRQLWKTYVPASPFDYYFMDENFNKQYDADRIVMSLFNTFTGLAVFICLIGLYGLISLIVIRRNKELAIRKVLGASLLHLVRLFTNELLLLVAVAAAVALPLAGIGASKWLASYAYHTRLSLGIFLWPVVLILLLTGMVKGYRILRAARANPVKALRSE